MILVPGALAQTVYKQATYIFHRGERIEGNHLPECMEGLDFIAKKFDYQGINPNFAYKNTIYSVRTLDSNGKLIDQEVEQIGEILECEDWQTHFPARLVAPVYYEITIGSKK